MKGKGKEREWHAQAMNKELTKSFLWIPDKSLSFGIYNHEMLHFIHLKMMSNNV
jgi:hypothetical protein